MNKNAKRILIINKDGGCTYTLNSLLNRWGYQVATVNTFIKGIEFCLHNSFIPHLIIVGVAKDSSIFRDFPDKFQDRIKKDVPIIAYTHLSSPYFHEEAKNAGYKDCLIRPVAPNELRSKIEYYIEPQPVGTVKATTLPKHHIDEEGVLLSKLKIKALNKNGLECYASFPLPKGLVTEIQSKLLIRLGLKDIKFVVEKTEKIDNANKSDEHHYLLKLNFLDLSIEQDYQLITFLKSQAPEDQREAS